MFAFFGYSTIRVLAIRPLSGNPMTHPSIYARIQPNKIAYQMASDLQGDHLSRT